VHCKSTVAVIAERGQFGNPGRGKSTVGSRYERSGEGTAKDTVRAIVYFRLCQLAIAPL
jgi:hypothetical protein